MSKVTDDSLKPHLTALIDGELEPLEAIALQQRLRQSPRLEAECRELERLKVAVHVAGTQVEPPRSLERSLEVMCREHFEARTRRRSWSMALLVPAGLALGALALAVAVNDAPTAEPTPVAVLPEAAEPIVARVEGDLLGRLAGFHRESLSPLSLADLKRRGALIAIERLPDTFITPEGQKPQLIQASWMGCSEREVGSTLAVLRADKVELPADIDTALATTGVFVDIVEGVLVRVSVSGDKLFVLMSTDEPAPDQTPI
jgi:hypothetical protein